MNIVFKEEQKFTQWWLWLIFIGIGIIPLYGIYKQLILGEKFGNNPMSDLGLILFCLFIFGIILLFWLMRLSTEIDRYHIKMSFFPFLKKHIKWSEIKTANIINYGFVGGWGIRIFTKYGTVYNIKGNKGLAIELLNGKKMVIGTQNETELKLFLEGLRRKDIE